MAKKNKNEQKQNINSPKEEISLTSNSVVKNMPAAYDVEGQKAAFEKEILEIQSAREKLKDERAQLKNESDLVKMETSQLKSEKAAFQEEKKKLETQKSGLAKKERELSEREFNAENEFALQNEKALEVLNKNKETLQNEIKKLQVSISSLKGEYEKTRLDKQLEADKAVEEYRKAKVKEVEAEYKQRKSEALSQLDLLKQTFEENSRIRDMELNSLKKDLEKKTDQYIKEKEDLERRERELKEKALAVQEKEEELNYEKKWLQKDKSILEETIKVRVEEQVALMSEQLREQEITMSDLNRKVYEYKRKLDEYEKVDLLTGQRSKEELMKEIEILKDNIRTLNKKLNERPGEEIFVELEEKSRNYEKLREDNKILTKKNTELEQEKHRWELSVSELQQEKEKREVEQKRLEAVSTLVKMYEDDVKKLKSLYEQPKEIKARIEVIEKPNFERKKSYLGEVNEIDWLNNIYEKCNESGLHFNKRLLYSFHTALKTADWSPLTVLAGVSGTGKSELPRLYSRFGGFYYLPLPVQPDWDSPQSLFGYFNSVDNRFNATPLLRSLTQFQNADMEDSMLMVLLDEMNLAHVELYFSELLSKLETRRGESKGVKLEIDLGAGLDKYNINLTNNVLWVGTMNEDETTKSLSDKVLDRGNLISFPRPIVFERRSKLSLADEGPMLSRSAWNKWIDNKVVFQNEIEKYKTGLEDINLYLEQSGRALGHRVWQAVENYMSNHPYVIKARMENNQADFDKYMRCAFEEALVHKVMPKLRGIELSSQIKKKCLDPIGIKLEDLAGGLMNDYASAKNSAYGVFVWNSAKYLKDNNEE